MKKIIAVSAGLLLVGSVSVASAEVTFTGDARERLTLQRNYDFGNVYDNGQQDDFNAGRIRVVVTATTKGGAYAKFRMRLVDGMDDGAVLTGRGGGVNNYYTDYGYIGIPIGPVTINAGLMPDFSSLWYFYDKRADRVSATWANKMTSVTGLFDKIYESAATTTNVGYGALHGHEDNDINQWGVIVTQKFAADWNLLVYGKYQDNQRNQNNAFSAGYQYSTYGMDVNGTLPDGSGFEGTVQVKGSAGPVKLLGELSYREKDLEKVPVLGKYGDFDTTKYENGYGGILHANMTFGPASGTLVLGFTHGGYIADGNYGFLMMGGAMAGDPVDYVDLGVVGSPITNNQITQIGAFTANGQTFAANTFFTGLVGDYKINKNIKLIGEIAYAKMSNVGSGLELGGVAKFDVTDGAYISVGAALLKPSLDKKTFGDDINTDTAYGAFTELGIKF